MHFFLDIGTIVFGLVPLIFLVSDIYLLVTDIQSSQSDKIYRSYCMYLINRLVHL